MDNKAQTTLFVILGLIIIIFLVLFLYVKGDILKSQLNLGIGKDILIPKEIREVKGHVDICLEEISKEGLYQIGQHGGYFNVPDPNIVFLKEKTPYYFTKNKAYIPTISIMERELSRYIQENLDRCLDFDDFRNKGFNILDSNYSISTRITNKDINIKMNYPITIEKADVKSNLNNFQVTINSNIKKLNSVSIEIVNIYTRNPGFICVTCLDEVSSKNNVIIKSIFASDVAIYKDNLIWFLVTDKEYNMGDKNLTLKFVVES